MTRYLSIRRKLFIYEDIMAKSNPKKEKADVLLNSKTRRTCWPHLNPFRISGFGALGSKRRP
jgi:hypothetical protein